ncbi:MAG: GlsB/YeaQ/YmgE family stress response membrane protein [Bacillota bacterium]|nr:GlsB/YeaQ/YmgE family stress response membrane protein [Bacillota bacterium]
MSVFWVWVIVGIIAGYLAKSVMREGPHGIVGDLIVGVIGAFVGGWIFNYFGRAGVTGLNITSIVVAFVGAVVFLWIIRQLNRGRAR